MLNTILEDTSTTLIEGISNDALLAIVLFCLFITAIMVWSRMSQNQVEIHPTNLQQVEATRARVLDSRDSTQSQRSSSSSTRSRDDPCPICLDQLQFAVETNCGHVFCCPCILSYWEHGNWISAMNCPVCRQEVRVLLSSFNHEEDVSVNVNEYRSKLRAYNRRFSGEPRPIWEYIVDFPVIVRHMFRNLFSVSGLVFMLRLRIFLYLALVVVYIVLPFDIIPEAVAGILGLLDDLAIAAVIILYLTVLFRNSLAN